MRCDQRGCDVLREVKIIPDYLKGPHGSALIEMGDTKVICTASVDFKVPPFLKDVPQGWVTAEYGMLPGSSASRIAREAAKGKITGRTAEIQRLIGRSLRSVVDTGLFPGMTVLIDCDVIQADGGTRTAAITGACVAMRLAFQRLLQEKKITKHPMKDDVAAVSVGMMKGEALLDLCYEEDVAIDVDMNVVMTGAGYFVEVQGTAEHNFFSDHDLQAMLALAKKGIGELIVAQRLAVQRTL